MSNSELSKKYQKKSDKQHILDNPDTYIGSVELLESEVYSDPNAYIEGQQNLPVDDYDEIWEDDDGYPD